MIAFETYPDYYIGGQENPDYDSTLKEFDVDEGWAACWIDTNYRMSVEDFIAEYTWDDTLMMYDDAWIADALMEERIVER